MSTLTSSPPRTGRDGAADERERRRPADRSRRRRPSVGRRLATAGLLAALGVSLLLSALFVFFRDLGHIWEILSLVLFYGSAVVFPFARIPASLRDVAGLNPIAQIVQDVRHTVVNPGNTKIPSMATAIGPLEIVPILITIAILIIGFAVFNRLTPKFAENL